jgi:hypothetical protein
VKTPLLVVGLALASTHCEHDESARASAGADAGGAGPSGGSAPADGGADPGDGGDAGSGAAGSGGDTPARAEVLIAQGHVGRTMLSCDQGATWIHDRSDDAAVRCDDVDCDHHTGSAMGIVASGGFAIMSSGWGTPGVVRRTSDGATWETVLEIEFPFASLAVGPGGLLGSTPRPWRSVDAGATWTEVPPVYIPPPLRQSLFIPDQGRYLLTSEGNGLRAWTTDDAGETFQEASALPSGCVAFALAEGAGIVAMQHVSGGICRSSDGGQSFQVVAVGNGIGFQTLAFAGGRFVALGDGGSSAVLYESADAQTWTETATNLQSSVWNLVLGSDAVTGAFVAAASAYETQRFFRSADGLDWVETTAPQGHPIRRFISASLATPSCSP